MPRKGKTPSSKPSSSNPNQSDQKPVEELATWKGPKWTPEKIAAWEETKKVRAAERKEKRRQKDNMMYTLSFWFGFEETMTFYLKYLQMYESGKDIDIDLLEQWGLTHEDLNKFALSKGFGNVYYLASKISNAPEPLIEGMDDYTACETSVYATAYDPADLINWGWYVLNMDKSWTTWVYKCGGADRQLEADINTMPPPAYAPAFNTLDHMLPYAETAPNKAKLLSKIQYKECVCGVKIQSCFHYCDACYSLADLFPECAKNVEEDKIARSKLTDKQKVMKRIQGRRHMIQTYNIHFRKRAKKLTARRKFVERPKKDLQELNIRFLQYKIEKDMSTCYDFCEAVAVETRTSRGLAVVATEVNIDPRSDIETVAPSLLRNQLSNSGFHEMVIDGTAKAVFDRLVADVAWDDIPIIPTHFGVGLLNMIKYLKTKALHEKEMTKKYSGKADISAELAKIDHYINALNTMNNVVIAKMSRGARRDKEWDDMRDRLVDFLEFGATKADIIELCKSVKIKMEEYLNDAELKSTNIEKCFVQ